MRDLSEISYHFLLAKERTASSLVVTMLNRSEQVLSVSEETFGLYLFDKYRNVSIWDENLLLEFWEDFLLMSKKNLTLFMGERSDVQSFLLSYQGTELSVEDLIKLIYLNFFPQKPKAEIRNIVDKQIDYLFHLPEVISRFPKARFVVLTRDPLTNVSSCVQRGLNGSSNVVYHAELYRTYYENVIPYLDDERFLIVKYEELVSTPKLFLSRICDHYGFDYIDEMLNVEGVLDELFEFKKGKVSKDFEKEFKDFHKGLFKPVSGEFDQRKKEVLKDTDKQKILCLTQEVASRLGYEESCGGIDLSPMDRIQQNKAVLSKRRLLELYWKIPIEMKLWIKRNRKKSIDV